MTIRPPRGLAEISATSGSVIQIAIGLEWLPAGVAPEPGDVGLPAVDDRAMAGRPGVPLDFPEQRSLRIRIRVAADRVGALLDSIDRQRLALQLVTEPLVERADASVKANAVASIGGIDSAASSRPSTSRPASRFRSDR